MSEISREDIENYRIEPRAYPREVVNDICDLALRALSAEQPAKEAVAWPENRCPQCGTVHPLLAAPPSADPRPSERRERQRRVSTEPFEYVGAGDYRLNTTDRRKPTERGYLGSTVDGGIDDADRRSP